MMPSDIRPRNDYLEPAGDMGFSLQLKKSSKQRQSSKIVKDRVKLPRENQSLKYQGKLKIKKCVDPQSSDLPHEPRRDADDGIFVQPKSSGDHRLQCVKGMATKDDELIKYMSNLPGYLQRTEKGENIQEKAFNVGVLDWARLEKWKYNQKHIPARSGNNSPSTPSNLSSKTTIKSSTFSSAAHSKTHAHQSGQHPSLCSSLNSSRNDGHSQGVKPSTQKVIRFQDLDTASKSNLDGQKDIPWTYKSFGRNSDVILEKEKRTSLDQKEKITSKTGNSSSNLRNGALNPKKNLSAWDGKVKKRVEKGQESDIKSNALDRQVPLDMGASSTKLGKYGDSLSSKGKLSVRNDEIKKREELQKSDIDLDHQNCPGEPKNIVLLLPTKFLQNSSLGEDQTLLNKNLTECNRNSFSDGFSSEVVYSADLHPGIPHSCPLPSKVETNIQPDMTAQSLINALGAKLSSDTSQVSPRSNKMPKILADNNHEEHNNSKSTNADVVGTLKTLDQEMAGLAARRSRNQSPNRRFSFSLGRMARSFSLKEGSAVPQLSSTYVSVKSGPVRSEASACLDDTNREKANGNNRARSSPLRRILDPLLKSKGFNSLHSSETVQPSKGSLKSSFRFRPRNASESLQNEKHESLTGNTEAGPLSHATLSIGKASSTIQAVLQLAIKNGLPLFKFVVENSGSMLAAPLKNSMSSGKEDMGQNYTFYSVNEFKKKSGSWISQGSKVKSCEYVYNVVGQMKVSIPRFLNLSGQNSDNQCMVRESVLFGVEKSQADQASPKFIPNGELASIVLKMPTENLSHDAKQRDEDKDLMEKSFSECLAEDGWSSDLGENEDSNSITVILPGGDHGLPNKGVPTPLIDRWKSGGSCDCGGWDVGCKLCVLSNQNQCSKIPRTLKACAISDCFELFVQGETQHNRPIFSLVPLTKGIYSVEFNSSVSLLQAFFICVTVMSQESSDLSEVSYLSEAKVFQGPRLNGNNGIQKTSTVILGEVPIPNPPLSPVGRV